MPETVTAPAVKSMRSRGVRVVCVTAYDAILGSLADAAGADVILVGDSVGNTLLGYSSTIPVELEDMIYHTRATRRGVNRALLVADLPFGSYQVSVEQAIQSSVRLIKAGAQAVKLEGEYTDEITQIVKAGIPVMGHVGMTPQSINSFGGFRVQGKGANGKAVLDSAKRIQDAGAFSIVLELIPADLAQQITDELEIPTIGIGAGVGCAGQVQVIHDLVGLNSSKFKHSKQYVDGYGLFTEALKLFAAEVRNGEFPTVENSF